MRRCFCFLLILITFQACSAPQSENNASDEVIPTIEVGGKAFVRIATKNLQDSVTISSSYRPLLQLQELFTDEYTVAKDTNLLLTFNISVPSKHHINLGKKEVPVFLAPSDTLRLEADLSQGLDKITISFEGPHANINHYLYDKPANIAYSILGAQIYNDPQRAGSPEETLKRYKTVSDSVLNLQHKYLAQNTGNYKLPNWFVEYEKAETSLSVAYNQRMLPFYWKNMFQLNLDVPNNYYTSIRKPGLEHPSILFCSFFYLYVNNLILEKVNKLDNSSPDNKESEEPGKTKSKTSDLQHLIAETDTAEALLEKELLYPFLTFYFSINIRDFESYDLGKQYLEYLEGKLQGTPYLSFIREKHQKLMHHLSSGSKAPGFYLLSTQDAQYLSLSDFKGKTLLLNFWYPGCKPCIAQIPYEKELLRNFDEGSFTILNICLESTVEQWQAALKKYRLSGINLVAQGNWEKKLKEGYQISGFPHYVLIDQDGNIIENKTYRPRDPLLAKLIEANIK